MSQERHNDDSPFRARLTVWYVACCPRRAGLLRRRRPCHSGTDQPAPGRQELEGICLQLTKHAARGTAWARHAQLAAEESRAVIASANHPTAVLSASWRHARDQFRKLPASPTSFPRYPVRGLRTIASHNGAWRYRVKEEHFNDVRLLLVLASPLNDLARDQREIREAIFLGIPIAVVVAGAGGLWLASIGLRPITNMARRAGDLPLTGIDDLGPPSRNDELGQLTRAFNALVARLRSALKTQRQFMADASHELRNPVSVIRSASDVALNREHRDEAEYREALVMISAQSRRLGALVEDMLVLARADAGGYPLRPVDFFWMT